MLTGSGSGFFIFKGRVRAGGDLDHMILICNSCDVTSTMNKTKLYVGGWQQGGGWKVGQQGKHIVEGLSVYAGVDCLVHTVRKKHRK